MHRQALASMVNEPLDIFDDDDSTRIKRLAIKNAFLHAWEAYEM